MTGSGINGKDGGRPGNKEIGGLQDIAREGGSR